MYQSIQPENAVRSASSKRWDWWQSALGVAAVCLALSPVALAQQGNTVYGDSALSRNTTGDNNTAIGHLTLLGNTEGSDNTATGAFALLNNTTGSGNTATGYEALYSNTAAHDNTGTGLFALYYNSTGNYNTALGSRALAYNTTAGIIRGQSLLSTLHSTPGNRLPVHSKQRRSQTDPASRPQQCR